MDKTLTFDYSYSAKENNEIQEIRKRYLPKEESKLDEIKRLDAKVQNSGMIESLCVGIGGSLCFGLGMCLAMQVIGGGVLWIILGIVIGLIGMAIMLAAYPTYRSRYNKAKEKYAPRILELSSEISSEG